MEFRWNQHNRDHIAEHGMRPEQAEFVIENAMAPWPTKLEDEKYLVRGQTVAGDFIQVIYILDPGGSKYVIHARPLKDSEKRAVRRRRR